MDFIIEEQEENLWVAATERGLIQGLEVDPVHERVRWGSIYWAKVSRIDTKLDAAFVDLDGEFSGILFNRDVRSVDKAGNVKKSGSQSIGKVLSPGDYVMVQAKQAYLEPPHEDNRPLEDKAPTVTMDISIQGRYLIYTPLDSTNRISSRIKGKKLRKLLDSMLETLKDVKGCILRASAAHTQSEFLVREAQILKGIWDGVSQHELNESGLILEGPDALQRILSDHADKSPRRIEVVIMEHFQMVQDWCELFAPELLPKIQPIELQNATMDWALFEHHDLIKQISSLFQSYVVLSGGGNILIQPTAALTAIDINRGSDRNSNFTINIEAADEVARQIRLRNLSGNILIDFINLNTEKERKQLQDHFEELINDDPCTIQIHGFTNAGYFEVSRQRRSPSLQDRIGYLFEK